MEVFDGFQVLLDSPADRPGLGFDDYALALSDIIVTSRAEFAVGIFGTWGSGKTTLMREIKRRVDNNPDVVSVWFTAWRYEKEKHLIVPLLDVLRDELCRRADAAAPQQSFAGRAAAAIGRAGRALLAGLSLSVGVPGFGTSLDAAKVLSSLQDDESAATEPLSFYHTGFTLLRNAIQEFSQGGTRRLVIFVDDLDRCLPSNALEVLESMKLFFDVEGCVFVVGLDQEVAERAVALKYLAPGEEPNTIAVSGVDYLKKIFQVPFALPRIGTDLLQNYLRVLVRTPGLTPKQQDDFRRNVQQHLQFLPGDDTVNPREVKRLINTYTLQLKILANRLGPRLDPNIVLALQCMSFRPDWRDLYDHLAADPQLFQSAMRAAVDRPAPPPDSVWIAGVKAALPTSFVEYLRTHARPLLNDESLPQYVSVAESTKSTDPSVLTAQTVVSRLRQAVDGYGDGSMSPSEFSRQVPGDCQRLAETLIRRSSRFPQLEHALDALERLAHELTGDTSSEGIPDNFVARLTAILDDVDAELRQLRRRTGLGAIG